MLESLKKLKYGVRVLLSRGGGQEETITVAGRSIAMRHGGEGAPFVYLHGTLGESSMWLPFFQSWSKQYHVMAPLHPGFGASGGFDDIDNIEDMAFHYLELFDALGLKQVNLGGVSLGGYIAAEFAIRWPERVRRLWLSGAPGLWVDEKPLGDLFRVMRDPEQLRKLLFYDPEGYAAKMIIVDNPPDERLMAAFQSMTVLARLVWERPYDPKLPQRLHRIQCPVLLIWGANDQLVPPAYAEAYRQHLPQAEIKLLPKSGHLPMFEAEKEFVETIAKFCAG